MIGCLLTRVRKQPIIALYFESETVLKFYDLEAREKAGYAVQKSLPVFPNMQYVRQFIASFLSNATISKYQPIIF